MSIDREINSRVDAFGSNPQALQKRYAATKQLVDLLALQRIKSQKDDVARQIQMEMQSNPATIKQQREQELFGRTAQEVAQQVGGAIQNRQRQQKQGMQRMAQRAAPPQGLGALQQPKRMQAGGIVAFREGNLVGGRLGESARIESERPERPDLFDEASQEQIDELIRRGLLPENFKGSVARRRAEEMLAEPVSETPVTEPVPAPEPAPEPEPEPAPVDEPKIPTAENALVLRDQGNQGIASIKPPPLPPATAPEEYDLQAGLEAVGEAPKPVMVDREGLEKRGVDFTKAYGVDPASIDPEEAGIEALTKAGGFYGIKKKDAELRQGLADLAAIDAAQTDPEKLRRERMKAFLLGAAGRGSTALAASGAASANLGRAQERDVRARQIKRNEMLRTIQDKDTEIRKLAKGEEKAAMERADNLKMEGLRIISNMSNAELSARQTDTNALNQRNIANYTAKMERVGLLLEESNAKADRDIERAQLASMDASRRGQIANAGIDDALRGISEIDKLLNAIYEDQIKGDDVLRDLNLDLNEANARGDSERAGKLSDQIVARQKQIIATVNLAQKDLNERKEDLDDKVLELEKMRRSALGGSSPNIALNSQDESLIDRYMP